MKAVRSFHVLMWLIIRGRIFFCPGWGCVAGTGVWVRSSGRSRLCICLVYRGWEGFGWLMFEEVLGAFIALFFLFGLRGWAGACVASAESRFWL